MASRRQVLASIAATATTPVTTAAALWAVGGCSSKPTTPTRKPVDRVTYLTGFGTTPREGYGWVADGMGFFAEVGIAVSINAGEEAQIGRAHV